MNYSPSCTVRRMPGSDAPRAAPRFRAARVLSVLSGLALAGLMAFALSLQLGEAPFSLSAALADPLSRAGDVLRLRLQHAVLAAVVGGALGASGCTLQALLRNPLADPFVLGVSGGAALGATTALALGAGTIGSVLGVGFWSNAVDVSVPALCAFVGALGATGLVFAVGSARGRTTPYAALLSGVIFNAFAAAAITGIKAMASPERVGEILHWLAGSLGYERSGALAAEGGLQIVAIGGLWVLSARLNLLTLGDEDAASLGVPVAPTRVAILLLSSLSVAAAVALSGLIGFVGLIVPHVLRLLLGPDQRLLVPASALGGAVFLLLSDTAARLLFRVIHETMPVGVVTALVGGPFFLVLLRRREAA
jgi:iron complex transport system permease protein